MTCVHTACVFSDRYPLSSSAQANHLHTGHPFQCCTHMQESRCCRAEATSRMDYVGSHEAELPAASALPTLSPSATIGRRPPDKHVEGHLAPYWLLSLHQTLLPDNLQL